MTINKEQNRQSHNKDTWWSVTNTKENLVPCGDPMKWRLKESLGRRRERSNAAATQHSPLRFSTVLVCRQGQLAHSSAQLRPRQRSIRGYQICTRNSKGGKTKVHGSKAKTKATRYRKESLAELNLICQWYELYGRHPNRGHENESKQESLHNEKKTLDTQQKDEWQQRPPHNAQELWLYEQIRWWVELRCEWQIYMKWGKASSWTLKEDYSWRGANAACETDAKLLFCPECFLHMQALEQVPPQPRDLHVPMVLTTAIGHPFSWSRQ